MELVRLGAAGCLYNNGDRCAELRIGDRGGGYACELHRMPLAEHWRGGQPVRAKVCSDEAGKDAWSRIMKARG